MLDLRLIRRDPDALRAEQKAASDAIAAAKRSGEDAGPLLERMRDMSAQVKSLTERARTAEERLQGVLATLPNLPDPTAAPEDTVIREVGEPGVREGRDHLELAGEMIDMERGARLSGSRFTYLRGELVMLEFALVRWTLEKLCGHGFEPVVPPVLVREQALYGTGFLPDTEQQIYRLPDDDLYLVGTSEVPLASMHAGEILDGGDLPRRYAGFSPCFRREAGAAGKDTQGIFRVHQFDKVEMFAFVEPERSHDEQERFRELTSCSNTTDYQARRLDIRFRPAEGAAPRHAHTLNGTAVAVGRTIIAIVENHQQEDGTVEVPEVLRPFGAPAAI